LPWRRYSSSSAGVWQWAFPLLALAVAVKFIMLLLGPLLLVWLLFRKPRIDRREIALSIGAGGAILAMIYLPFIAASHSFANYEALQSRFISSPASLTIAFLMQYTSLQRAEDYGRALALTLYACGYLWALYRCRGGFENLVTSACWATFFTLALPTWWFWPWYVVWLLPIAAMVAGRRVATLALLFGSTALLVYPIYYWRDVLLNGPNWYSNQFVIVGAVSWADRALSRRHLRREPVQGPRARRGRLNRGVALRPSEPASRLALRLAR